MIAAELISRSLDLAQVTGDGQEISGYSANVGLSYLNNILSDWSGRQVFIPYTTSISIPIIPNIYEYSTSQLITSVDEANIISNVNVLYRLRPATEQMFSTMNFLLTQSIPSFFYLGKNRYNDTNGNEISKIYFYPTPQINGTANLIAKVTMPKLALDSTLDTFFPQRYFLALQYELAKQLLIFFKTVPSDYFRDEYEKQIQGLRSANPQDLSVTSSDIFLGNSRFQYGIYNRIF